MARLPAACSAARVLALIALLTGAVSAVGRVAHCASDPCHDRDRLVEGLKAARGRLLQGVYRVTGECNQCNIGYGKVDGDVAAFCAFDYVRKRSRWDREEPATFVVDGKVTPLRVGLKYVRTPDRMLVFDETSGLNTTHSVVIRTPDWKAPKIASPFDVRTFGLMGWSSIEQGATFEDAVEQLERASLPNGERDQENLCQLVVQLTTDVRNRVWIDCEHGFTVVKSELEGFSKPDGKWAGPMARSEVKWEERNEHWVPTSFFLERNFNGKEVYSIDLEWLSVNEDPEPNMFEPSGLGLDPEFLVADARLGDKPVIVGQIGVPRHPARDDRRFVALLFRWSIVTAVVMLGVWAFRRWARN